MDFLEIVALLPVGMNRYTFFSCTATGFRFTNVLDGMESCPVGLVALSDALATL